MKICIIPGENQLMAEIKKLASLLKNQNHNISIGLVHLVDIKDLIQINYTNLIEYDYQTETVLENYTSDVFIFFNHDWKSLKSFIRILSSIENGLLSPKKILLHDSEKWDGFLNMLKNTYKERGHKEILKDVFTIDHVDFSSLAFLSEIA